jgi:hypothetical protein
MKRQNTTNADDTRRVLTPQQEAAADQLAAGRTVTETAAAVGVTRQTVSEWLHHHHAFKAALNHRRNEAWTSLLDRLASLAPVALDVLMREVEQPGPRALEAAVHVLKACGLYGTLRPVGSTDPEDFVQAERDRERDKQLRAMLEF